jgi:lysophospholipase L1-like esterase
MQPDGIHPRAAAQPRLLDNVWPYLEPLLKPETEPVAAQRRSGG